MDVNDRRAYINTPENNEATAPELGLFRPEIKYRKAVIFVVTHMFIAFFIFYLVYYYVPLIGRFSRLLLIYFLILMACNLLTFRFSLIWFLRVYQRYAKSETRLRCCMIPSCSEFAILSLRKYGVLISVFKIYKRLHRCHPPGGEDYP